LTLITTGSYHVRAAISDLVTVDMLLPMTLKLIMPCAIVDLCLVLVVQILHGRREPLLYQILRASSSIPLTDLWAAPPHARTVKETYGVADSLT
jgi:hypothetical protein